jgi:hypothetical protein
MADPPFEAGAVKVTVAVVLSYAVAVPMVGAPGAPTGVDETEDEGKLVPVPFAARTTNE